MRISSTRKEKSMNLGIKSNVLSAMAALLLSASIAATAWSAEVTFPEGTATPSETCGACHKAIHREFAFGYKSDIHYKPTTIPTKESEKLTIPAKVSATATAHAFAGVEPYPIHAREAEEEGKSCNVCHFPEPLAIPDINTPAMCAYCHSMGKRVIGKQTQTFLEWRDDFNKPGLGRQHCQDCHMPRTMRKVAEDFDNPERAVARHLWTGGRSQQRLASALSLTVSQPDAGKADLAFHVINIGAGHSVPTGSNRRAIYLHVEVASRKGKTVATKEWMFAPWYGPRPDDRKYLEEDKKRPDAIAASQAEAQGPHETNIRAGEERILTWLPKLKSGEYTVKARLVYDLNRYNPRSFTADQTEINRSTLTLRVK